MGPFVRMESCLALIWETRAGMLNVRPATSSRGSGGGAEASMWKWQARLHHRRLQQGGPFDRGMAGTEGA